jgi:hypothetical protein
MLGDWPLRFRMFLMALRGEGCPIRGVLERIESEEAARLARSSGGGRLLCGFHLARVMAALSNEPARVGMTRSTLGAAMNQKEGLDCAICKSSERVAERRRWPIRCLDSRVRFQRAIEEAPLFCRAHLQRVGEKSVPRFHQIQQRKIQKLFNELAQAQMRKRPELELLLDQAVTYSNRSRLPAPSSVSGREPRRDESRQDLIGPALREFVKWESRRQLEYLGNLEGEAASLRYRNSALAEENRALELARVAEQSIRQELERDRAELLAKQSGERAAPNSSLAHGERTAKS